MPDATLYRAHLLSPRGEARLEEHPDGGLLVEGGRIAAVGPFEAVRAARPAAEVRDLRPHWILPGFVDAHSHLPQYEAVAMDGQELLPWLERFIFPAEARFADAAAASAAARTYFDHMLAQGTTTAVVYGSVHAAAADAAFREAEACGIRCALGKVMMDRHAPAALQEDTEASLAQSRELAETWHGRDGGRLMYAFAPRFAPMCTQALMKGTAVLAERFGALVQTHLAENLDELAWVAELFPEAGSYTDVYDRMGLLRPGTLLGHGIHLSPAERARIRETGAAVVHCPRSNAFLKSGVMPLRRWLDEGLHVALGTDVGAGPSLSMRAEMETLCQASKLRWAAQHVQSAKLAALDLDEAAKAKVRAALDLEPQEPPADPALALFVATLGGARALGLGDRIGSLEAGKDADFLVLDPAAGNPGPVPDTAAQVLSRLVYRPETPALRATYVRGRRCWAGD